MSAIVVIFAGSLLHFAWEWSGRSTIVAVFAATNESTWEHLKLAFWPALALTPIQRKIYGSVPGWLPATAIRCMLPSFVIVTLFYGYTALLGSHYLAADLTIFAIAIFAGEFLGHVALAREFGSKSRIGAFGLLILATVLFSTLTFRPPDFFLFHEPHFSRQVHNDVSTSYVSESVASSNEGNARRLPLIAEPIPGASGSNGLTCIDDIGILQKCRLP